MLKGLDEYKKIHFTGVGGIGVSALARMCLIHGKKVTGSDRVASEITKNLSLEGALIFKSESEKNISDSHNLLVYTPAVSKNHPEILKAKKINIPTLSYPEVLGLISKNMFVVAVSGTHGKTTTTAMLVHILENTGRNPMAIVGSLIKNKDNKGWYSNFRHGDDDCFIVEACEYKRSFSYLYPNILVVTNIEEDHLDYYKDLSDIQSAFGDVVSKLPKDGSLICSLEDENIEKVVSFSKAPIIDYGREIVDKDILSIPGEHNRLNAKAALATAQALGVSGREALEALKSFSGTWRRFEYKGQTVDGALVYDDYAHHPREIQATILGARERFKGKKIIVVFQPHLNSRTDFFFNNFVESLSLADSVILTPVYQARKEKHKTKRSVFDMTQSLLQKGCDVFYVKSIAESSKKVLEKSDSKSVIIMMGAGDIYTVTESILLK
jgi:UDP-N-acetylmuramate--alanine ligase